jgi:hypothetical protein
LTFTYGEKLKKKHFQHHILRNKQKRTIKRHQKNMVGRFDSIDQLFQDSAGSGDDDGFEGEIVGSITKMILKKMMRMKI